MRRRESLPGGPSISIVRIQHLHHCPARDTATLLGKEMEAQATAVKVMENLDGEPGRGGSGHLPRTFQSLLPSLVLPKTRERGGALHESQGQCPSVTQLSQILCPSV